MKETLNKLFAHSNITYEFDRNYVILKKVKKTVSRKTVKGRITDKHGEPMAGATITDKDGKTGVISDMDGNYMIQFRPEVFYLISSSDMRRRKLKW